MRYFTYQQAGQPMGAGTTIIPGTNAYFQIDAAMFALWRDCGFRGNMRCEEISALGKAECWVAIELAP